MRLFSRYYDSIHDCPLIAWNKATTTGDLKHIHRGGWYSEGKARKAWVKMQDEYIKAFGIPQAYKDYLTEMARAAKEFSDAYNGERWKLPIAQIRRAQAEGRIGLLPKADFNVSVSRVSKVMGFRVDPQQITVAEFYGYIKGMG